jgi:hypothetical protein
VTSAPGSASDSRTYAAGETGSLYVKRWEFHRGRAFTECVLEFGTERIGFDLGRSDAFVRIPRAAWRLSLRIEGMPEGFDGTIPVPTEIERWQFRARARVQVIRGAWECSAQPMDAVARLHRVDTRYLEVLARRGGWKRVEIKAADVDAFRRALGLA